MSYISADARNKYEEVIAHNIAHRKLFTALDISRIVQKMLQSEGKTAERHRDMKGILHQMFDNDETPWYDRHLKDVGGNDGPAYVYHYYQDNPDTYGQHHTPALPTNFIMMPTPQALLPAPPPQDARAKGTWYKGVNGKPLDVKERIRFPKSVLSAAGFIPGDSVYLSVPLRGGYISVTDTPPCGLHSKKYAIDCYGNLRANVSKHGFLEGAEFVFKAQIGLVVADAV